MVRKGCFSCVCRLNVLSGDKGIQLGLDLAATGFLPFEGFPDILVCVAEGDALSLHVGIVRREPFVALLRREPALCLGFLFFQSHSEQKN